MFKRFAKLEWKSFFRSASFNQKLIIKIFMAYVVFCSIGLSIGIGVGLYFGTEKLFPEKDPWFIVNNFIIYYFLLELILRYLIQKMPVLHIKPLLILPIKRKSVINYGLAKSLLSIFNFIPLFIFITYSITLLFNGYSTINVLTWFISIVCIMLTLNFVTFLLNKSNTIFYIILTLLVGLIVLEYYKIFEISQYAGVAFNYLSKNPINTLVPILLLALSYFTCFNFMKKNLTLDNFENTKKEAKTTDLSWLNRFGKVAPFLKNDIKLIWRNVRPKKTVLSAAVFLFYALIFIFQRDGSGVYSSNAMLAFAMMFVTGGFAITFGQFVPSWDSEYYQILMSQNIKYKTYLDSKWYLMSFGVIVSFILATPYLYFGWKIYLMLIAGAFFNLGINSYLVLLGGIFNRTPIKLNEKAKAFGNTQGFNMTNMLIGLPKVLLPILMFAIPNAIWGYNYGIGTIIVFSLIGIFFKNYFLTKIEHIYQSNKYKTVAAYNQKT